MRRHSSEKRDAILWHVASWGDRSPHEGRVAKLRMPVNRQRR